jgi:hypothetical protein|tara:strand:- start:630 stop:869 length:240 start_codon:yes stop_codon:yes gene_type:complete
MMDDEFEVGGMVLVQNEAKTAQELSLELAVTLYAAYEKQITAEGLALKVVEVARIFEAYLNEGYEDQPEADIISLKEVT